MGNVVFKRLFLLSTLTRRGGRCRLVFGPIWNMRHPADPDGAGAGLVQDWFLSRPIETCIVRPTVFSYNLLALLVGLCGVSLKKLLSVASEI